MSSKNFMAYGDAETILTGYANKIKDRLRYKDNAVLGAKNLLPNEASTTTINNVLYTVNSDGTVNVSRTDTQTQISTMYIVSITEDKYKMFAGKTLFMSGCPEGGSNDTYYLECYYNDGTEHWLRDTGNGLTIAFPAIKPTTIRFLIGIKVASVIPSGGLTFEPMIRLATDTDNTYAPYAMTNKQLTDALSYLEQSVTLSTSGDTTVTFTDSRFTTDSVIDIGVSEWGIVPKSVTCTTGVCTVVFGSVDSAHTITCRVYTR